MLVLTRKENEKIRIGKDIVLNIVSISENNIKLGIDAPKDVKIFREEIYQSIKEHAKQATVNSKKVLGTNYKALKLNKIIKNAKK
ncbi:MAG: carbon storage regulator CsrA [Ignavibacteriae bacterium]|nr:carbon storage regulator CsrA [Ignavibacteriota bacterium]